MKTLKYLICLIIIFIGFNSCEQLNQSTHDENIDWSEGDYAYIDLEKNTEWETGIIAEDGRYLLVKKDTTNNGYIGYINSQAFDSDGIALYFNESLELLSFVTNKGICYINRTEENKADILLLTDNENELFENIAISSTKIVETKVVPVVPIIVGLATGAATIMTIWDTVQATKTLADGNWDGAKLDYLKIIAGTVTPTLFGGFIVDGSFRLLDKTKEDLDNRGQTCFLGNCQIQINKTKVGIKRFRIDVTVTGYETLPIISKITGEKSVVFGGIAVARTPYVTINSNEQIIQDWVINGNGTNSIEFELPENHIYYAVPYLLPTRGGKYEFTSNTRHGNIISLPYFNGVIDEFKQISYTENNDTYTFKCYAHASCNTKEDEYWKLYYENDLGWKEFYSAKTYNEPSISATNNGEFEFDIELHASKFKDVNTKNIKLGIAKFDKNHYLLITSEPQIFELNVTRKRLKRYNTHNVLYYDEKGRIVKKVDTRYNYVVEIIYNDTNNSASIYEDGEYSGIAEISNGLVRSICGETISYDSNNYFIKSRNCSQTWSNGNITRSSKTFSDHTEYSNFTYGDKLNKLNFDVWASYNCYFPTYYVYFPNKNITTHLPISCNYTYGNATYTYEFDNDGYVTKAIEHFTTSDGNSGTETITFEYETY